MKIGKWKSKIKHYSFIEEREMTINIITTHTKWYKTLETI